MNPRDELTSLIARLRAELATIAPTPGNRLRIADRNRELARCTSLLAKLEGQATPVGFDPATMFPDPNDEPDDEPFDPDRLEHALNDPFVPTDSQTIDELRLHKRRLAGWFTFDVPETDAPD